MPLFHDRYQLETLPQEMRMSHWIQAPTLTDVSSGEVLLDLSDDIWDLRAAQAHETGIQLSMARYPDGQHTLTLMIWPDRQEAEFAGQRLPLRELPAALAAWQPA